MPTRAASQPFDIAGYLEAMRERDAGAWSDFFAPDAQWLVYRHHNPAFDPTRFDGNVAVHRYLRQVCDSDAHLHVEDVVVGDTSVWMRRMVRLGDGRMVIEHVHLKIEAGLIAREIDVASWDYP
jgi:3',5'-cyclic AMP phosphodiesterase CpdA